MDTLSTNDPISKITQLAITPDSGQHFPRITSGEYILFYTFVIIHWHISTLTKICPGISYIKYGSKIKESVPKANHKSACVMVLSVNHLIKNNCGWTVFPFEG